MIETFQSIPVLDADTPEGAELLKRVFWEAIKGVVPIAGGAEIFPDEGLDHILNKVPRATTAIATTYYLGLFTGSTAATARGATSTASSWPPPHRRASRSSSPTSTT
jgi:hypothetical protein